MDTTLLRKQLDEAITASKSYPAAMWEMAEDALAKRLCADLLNAMMDVCIWRGLEKESLSDIVLLGETHPMLVTDAITDARDRLAKKGVLTADLKEACEHVLDFAANRQEKLSARRVEQKGTVFEETDNLMRKLRSYGFC